jgi:ribose transport system permease protein
VRGTLTAIFVLAISITGISMLGAPNWVDGIFYGTALIVSVATVQFVWGRGT